MTDGKRNRKPGEFQARRKQLQARQARHDEILGAVKEATEEGEAWLHLDGYQLLITPEWDKAISYGDYSYLAIVRTKSFGLRIGNVCTKDMGYVTLVGKDLPTIGLARNQEVAYVRKVLKDGAEQEWIWV